MEELKVHLADFKKIDSVMAYNTQDVVHWYLIKVYTKLGGDIVEIKRWDNMRWNVRIKWDWYFKYRAALLQVKYPRFHVEQSWGHIAATGKTQQQILQDKIRSKKAKITEFTNKIEKAKKHWRSLFPIEDDQDYIKATEKLNRIKDELECLNQQLNKT
jgi:hypothetical protein